MLIILPHSFWAVAIRKICLEISYSTRWFWRVRRLGQHWHLLVGMKLRGNWNQMEFPSKPVQWYSDSCVLIRVTNGFQVHMATIQVEILAQFFGALSPWEFQEVLGDRNMKNGRIQSMVSLFWQCWDCKILILTSLKHQGWAPDTGPCFKQLCSTEAVHEVSCDRSEGEYPGTRTWCWLDNLDRWTCCWKPGTRIFDMDS